MHAVGVETVFDDEDPRQNAGTPYYAMEFVEGDTLAQLVRARRAGESSTSFVPGLGTPEEGIVYYGRVAGAFAGVADGLQRAHSAGVIHRDVKPSNLMLERQGDDGAAPAVPLLRLLDFGLARLEGQETLTVPGDLVGTVFYMSPEQAKCHEIALDHRTDVYSLGATLYEFLAGAPPFRGRDHGETLSQIIDGDPRPPRSLDARIPVALETVVLKCVRKDRAGRYQTAGALAEDLRRFVRGEAIEACPETRFERWARRLRRERIRLTIAGLLAILVVSWIVIAWITNVNRMERVAEEYARSVRSAVELFERGRTTFDAENGRHGALCAPGLFSRGDYALLVPENADPLAQSVDALEHTAGLVPHRPEAWYWLARVRLLMGDSQGARDAMVRSLPVGRDFPPLREIATRVDLELGPTRVEPDWSSLWENAWSAAFEHRHEGAVDGFAQLCSLERGGNELFLGSAYTNRMAFGRSLLALGRYDEALAEFDKALVLTASPGPIEPVLLRARTVSLMGDDDRCEEILLDLWTSRGGSDEIAFWAGAIYRSLKYGSRGRIVEWADRASSPLLAARLRARGLIALKRDREAIEVAERALDQFPGDATLRVVLFNAYFNVLPQVRHVERFIRALPKLERIAREATEIDPSNATAWAFLGYARGSRAFHEYPPRADTPTFAEALAACERALELSPRYHWSQVALGMVLWLSGDAEAALAHLEASWDERYEFEIAVPFFAGIMARSAARYELAASWFERAPLATDPSSRAVEHFFIPTLTRLERWGRLIRFAKGLPSRVRASKLHSLARAHAELGNASEATRILLGGIRGNTELERHFAELGRLMRTAGLLDDGESRRLLGRWAEEPFESVEQGSLEDAAAAAIHRTLAVLFLLESELQDLQRASQHAELAITKGGREASSLGLLAEILVARGVDQEASSLLREAVEKPGFTWAHAELLESLSSRFDLEPPRALYGFDVSEEDDAFARAELDESRAIRVNCGGPDHVAPDGTVWSRDRFHDDARGHGAASGARGTGLPSFLMPKDTDDPERFRSCRAFHPLRYGCGYRVPLVPGDWLLRLSFCETRYEKKRSPRFRRRRRRRDGDRGARCRCGERARRRLHDRSSRATVRRNSRARFPAGIGRTVHLVVRDLATLASPSGGRRHS